jgi:hypothetical protein
MVIAVPFVLGPLSHSLAEDDLETRRSECKRYGQNAKEQVDKYNELKCDDKDSKDSARWNPDEGAHFGWCFLLTESDATEAGYNSRQEMIDAALKSREHFLAICKQAGQGTPANGASTEDVDFKCPERIGNVTFRDDQIKSYYNAPQPGSDAASVVCDYYLPKGGQIRLSAQWTEGYVEWPVERPDPPKGCANDTGAKVEEPTERGRLWRSPSMRAAAGIAGEGPTPEAQAEAVENAKAAMGPLNKISIFAELRARPCH